MVLFGYPTATASAVAENTDSVIDRYYTLCCMIKINNNNNILYFYK